ncbi:MAG: thioredoxin domain-containing protein [Candidatus Woesearchaeota archaeon]
MDKETYKDESYDYEEDEHKEHEDKEHEHEDKKCEHKHEHKHGLNKHYEHEAKHRKGPESTQNYWMFAALILGLLLIILLGMKAFGIGVGDSGIGSGALDGELSLDKATDKALNVINNNLLQPGTTAEIKSKDEESGMYKMSISVSDQDFDNYITRDGKLLFLNPIDLDKPPAAQKPEGDPDARVDIDVGDDTPMDGKKDAPVTIIVFSDFSCPFCGGAAGLNEEVVAYLKQGKPSWEAPMLGIMSEYVETGKAKIYFMYYPGHGTGVEAMKLGWCANEQGKFWETHDIFFTNQDVIADVVKLKELMKDVKGLDMDKVEKCIESKKYDAKIAEDTQKGKDAGVGGTPGFFINGRKLSGAQSFSALKIVIDEELAK